MIRIVPLASPAEPSLAPDTIWDGIVGDWSIAGGDEDGNRAGLRARAQIATAVLLCLMTDARVEIDELPPESGNRGWAGDSFDLRADLGEAAIGSKLWLLRRSVANARTAQQAEDYARAALQPLIGQGAIATADVTATAMEAARRIDLRIVVADRVGTVLLDRKYQILWDQIRGMDRPLDR